MLLILSFPRLLFLNFIVVFAFRPYLVECPDKETRSAVCSLLYSACNFLIESEKEVFLTMLIFALNAQEISEIGSNILANTPCAR